MLILFLSGRHFASTHTVSVCVKKSVCLGGDWSFYRLRMVCYWTLLTRLVEEDFVRVKESTLTTPKLVGMASIGA